MTWQHDPCRTITVNIQGIKTPAELTIFYDTEPHSHPDYYRFSASGFGFREVFLPDKRKFYHIELMGLAPGTRYYFAIGDRSHLFTQEMSFRSLPEEETPLLFIEGGDWENTPEAAVLATCAGKIAPHAVLLGGDYPSTVDGMGDYRKWDKWLDVYRTNMVTPDGCLIPMVMAIGNHEVVGGFDQTKEKVPFFLHYFKQGTTEKSYFSLSFGKKIQLFVLDSGHAASHSGQQLEWLQAEMEKYQKVPIKIALYHVPLFPSIRFVTQDAIYRSFYGLVELCNGKKSASHLFSQKSQEGQKHWLPVFDKYALTVAFEHHDQTLKRTKLLKDGREDPKGTLYLGDGGWGPKIQYAPIQGYFHSYFANLQGKVHFFWVVQIDNEKITYSAMNASGCIIDQFIQKL